MQSRLDLVFGVIPPGLEPVLADELTDLGARETEIESGGVSFRAGRELLYRVHRQSRTATRFWVRVGRFRATTLEALAAAVRALPWADYVHPKRTLSVRVASSGSRLSHRDTVANKVELAVRDALRGPRREGARPPREPLEILVRIEDDEVEISVDASGERLHIRGWRKDSVTAPIRENLAAAVLWLSGWQPDTPLVDPMCGSGTFLIEGAGIALGHPPGDRRRFAFETWPSFDDALWRQVSREEIPAIHPSPLVLGCDRDPDAAHAARENAKRAGISATIHAFDLRELELPEARGTIVSNPPYGERLEKAKPAWRALGSWLSERARGWRVALLSPDPSLPSLAGIKAPAVARFSNGGIRVGIYLAERYGER